MEELRMLIRAKDLHLNSAVITPFSFTPILSNLVLEMNISVGSIVWIFKSWQIIPSLKKKNLKALHLKQQNIILTVLGTFWETAFTKLTPKSGFEDNLQFTIHRCPYKADPEMPLPL